MLLELIVQFSLTENSLRTANFGSEKVEPFLQWVGGKRSMLEQYKEYIPKNFNNYYEPFLGGGAMFFHLACPRAILNDINPELISTYEGIKNNPHKVIAILKELKARHSKELYMKVRSLDREINIHEKLECHEIAARMIYLNQTCFNGIYRVNKKGQFNVPIGSSLNRLILDEKRILNASNLLQDTELRSGDFETAIEGVTKNDFVYIDPPYFPISKYSDFTRYSKEKFFKEDQERLLDSINQLDKIGAKVLISNSYCDYTLDLYSKYNVLPMESGRTLNSNKSKRGRVKEILATNF